MSVWSRVKWLGFVSYVGLFLSVPLALLWGSQGAGIGLGLAVALLAWMRGDALARLSRRLGATRLSAAEFPQLSHWVGEYCRRLGLRRPMLAVIESPAINSALYGFSKHHAILAITRGALTSMRREELSALVARQLTFLWYGDVGNQTWLAAFLGGLEKLAGAGPETGPARGRSYSFRVLLKQTVLYPLTIVPTLLLLSRRSPEKLDLQSVRLTGKPRSLAEMLRFAEAMRARAPLFASFSTRHLFLLSPPTRDPLARVFFRLEPIDPRIAAIESLRLVVGAT